MPRRLAAGGRTAYASVAVSNRLFSAAVALILLVGCGSSATPTEATHEPALLYTSSAQHTPDTIPTKPTATQTAAAALPPAATATPVSVPTSTVEPALPTPAPSMAPPARAPAASTEPTPSIRLMAVGDVMLGWEVGRKIRKKGPGAPWTGVKQYFDNADLVVANLECVISRLGEPWPTKLIHLRAPLKAAESLSVGGVDVVSVANNHALDFGRTAFLDTLSRLDAQGVEHAGGGADSTAAHEPLIVEQNGLRLAFLGYVMPFSSKTSFNTRDWQAGANRAGVAIGTPDVVRQDVARIRDAVDLVVVMVHGGVEYRSRPNDKQRLFAAAALDAGATLVLGHHPHVLQGYIRSDGKVVAYSLGNFVFARFEGASNDSAILDVTLTRDGVASLAWIPVVIERGIPRPAQGDEIARIMGRLPQL